MDVLILGASGQLGRALCRSAPGHCRVMAPARAEMDLGGAALEEQVAAAGPALIINAAAWTDVDGAEDQPDAARAVNTEGPRRLARAAARLGARLVHLSTDYVFDGAAGRPYRPGDPVAPLNVYGRTKAEGEAAVLGACPDRALVVRTAWLYAAEGRNFVLAMLERMARGEPLQVVDDQVGTPTFAGDLAAVLWQLADRPELHGIVHWTPSGVASWYDFAVAIQEEALELGLLPAPTPILPVPASGYPARARRPQYSVLDKSACREVLGAPAEHWRCGLRRMLAQRAGA
jgi:dTDP-4-dehydrorhamnose reductase